jgi:hypothetical protein
VKAVLLTGGYDVRLKLARKLSDLRTKLNPDVLEE